MNNNINTVALKRLSNYKSVLFKLKALGFVKVFSDNLGDAIGVPASQVRSDFSHFGMTLGKKKGGYLVDELLEQIQQLLGKGEIQKVILIGCGKMGTALMNYGGFSIEGMKIIAGFDVNPAVIDPKARVPIYDLSEVKKVVREESVSIAIITVPEPIAPQVYHVLECAGIQGILNFAPIQLRSSDYCIVHNINIALEIENMFYLVKEKFPDGPDKNKKDCS